MPTDAWGIDDGYWDTWGNWHVTAPHTVHALRAAMGATPHPDVSEAELPGPPPPERPLWIVTAGDEAPLSSPCDLELEDRTTLRADARLPADLPIGYHRLHPLDGGPTTRLIVTPGRCHLPPQLRAWVLVAQLYACRSQRSWGIGDFGDLRHIATWAAERGAGMVAVNPLHAPLPTDQVHPSPYFASTRRWINPLYLEIERIPRATEDPVVAELAAEARRLLAHRHIDHDRVWHAKRAALARLWEILGADLRFDRWRDEQGAALETYARFCALAEHHGTGWSRWPAEHRHPARPGVARFAAGHADRVAFWAWVQLLCHDQLDRVSDALPILHDLAIGVDRDGADAWEHQDLLALDVCVGAPPDLFNREGQNWGLPPFIPWKLRDVAYRPLVELWRANLRTGGGLRIDHVMGLFRLFWLPVGAAPSEGGYVRYPGDELLAVLAIESTRAGALVVGEDLGTVEEEVRAALGAQGVLSTRLVWFEDTPPAGYPEQAFAAVTTHDLPTVAGVWSGADVEDQRSAGHGVAIDADRGLRARLAELTGSPPDAPVEDVIVAVHSQLARAPSMLTAVTLEDAVAVHERPNLPGTTTERPNWALALPMSLDEVFDSPLANTLAVRMTEGRSTN
jgi:4-alpha-glucanotransferase